MSFARAARGFVKSKSLIKVGMIILTFAFLWLAIVSVYSSSPSAILEKYFQPNKIPGCSSTATFTELKHTLLMDANWAQQLSNFIGDSLISFRRSKEIAISKSEDKRYCEVELSTPIGSTDVTYVIEWYDPSKPTIDAGIKVRMLDEIALKNLGL